MNHVLRCSGYELLKSDITGAHGPYLYDAAGKRYLDLEAGVWCAALGHSHPRLVRVIQSQVAEMTHLGYRYSAEFVEETAWAVLDTLGFHNGKVLFLSAGSEAVEVALRVALAASGKRLSLALSDAYLAAYGSAGRKSGEAWHNFDWQECAACQGASCHPQCERLREIPFHWIGAFVFEPGSSGGLIRFPPRKLIQTLAARTTGAGGMVVVDEVTTGLGRTGTWYGFEHYGLEPDVVALGKGLGNGYPVSAVAMAGDVAAALEDTSFHHAQSHQNDPLACAVAREVLAILAEEGLVEGSRRVGGYFLAELEGLAARHDAILEVRGRGLMVGVEFHPRFPLAAAHRALIGRGYLAGYKPAANLLRFYPPLILGEEEVRGFCGALDGVLAEGDPG